MKKKIHQDVIVGIIMILLSIFLFIKTFEFPGDAAFYPRLVIFIFAFFACLIVFGGIKKSRMQKLEKAEEQDGEEESLSFSLVKSPIIVLLIVVIYAGLLNLIGFFPSTFLFVFTLLFYLGVKDWKVHAFTSIGLNLFIYLLFVLQLNVQLPLGILFE